MAELDNEKLRESELSRGKEILLFLNNNIKEEDTSFILRESFLILDLSIRVINCLKSSPIRTIGDLINSPISDLIKIRNFGMLSLKDVRIALAKFRLKFKEEPYFDYDIDPYRNRSETAPILEKSVAELDIQTSILNIFKGIGIRTIADLIATPIQDLLSIPNFGDNSLEKVAFALAKHNLKFLNTSAHKAAMTENIKLRKKAKLIAETNKAVKEALELKTRDFAMKLILENRFEDKEIAVFSSTSFYYVEKLRKHLGLAKVTTITPTPPAILNIENNPPVHSLVSIPFVPPPTPKAIEWAIERTKYDIVKNLILANRFIEREITTYAMVTPAFVQKVRNEIKK